jgi:hypothetical protein
MLTSPPWVGSSWPDASGSQPRRTPPISRAEGNRTDAYSMRTGTEERVSSRPGQLYRRIRWRCHRSGGANDQSSPLMDMAAAGLTPGVVVVSLAILLAPDRVRALAGAAVRRDPLPPLQPPASSRARTLAGHGRGDAPHAWHPSLRSRERDEQQLVEPALRLGLFARNRGTQCAAEDGADWCPGLSARATTPHL